jgi:5'(3')-deoxyribonucleotidase
MARDHDLVLGVDVDNVLADYTAGLRAVVASGTGRDPADLPVPTRWANYEEWGLDATTFPVWHERAVVEHRMFRTLEPLPGAAAVLHRLSDRGVRIRIVTHRLYLSGTHSIAAADTVQWLDDNDIPYWDLCMIARKGDVGCDLYVDDAPHNVLDLRERGHRAVIFDQPYNRDVDGPRAHDWSEVERLCDTLLFNNPRLFEV